MRYLIIVAFMLLPLVALPQSFSREETLQDFTFLKDNILKYQPTLNLYAPGFEKQADSLLAQLPDSLDRFQYFQELSRLVGLAGEGHYALGTWDDTIRGGILANRYAYLPVGVFITDDRVFVDYDLSSSPRLNKGDEILSINGIPVAEILHHLCQLIPTDGDIKTYPLRKLESGFNWLYYLGYDQPADFRLEVKREDINMTIDLPAITRARMVENARKLKEDEQVSEENPLDRFYLLQIEDSLATLRLKGFSRSLIEELGLKAKKFYKEIFRELADKNVQVLVIDLRGNNGGRLEFERELLPYVMKQQPEAYYRTSVSWEGKERKYKAPKKSKLAFEGSIYVFIDGESFSAGSSLARHLREYADATIIGEESGSRYEGFAAGSKQVVVLPNSKVEIGIPRYSISYPGGSKQNTLNRGVLPDIKVNRDIQSLLNNSDPWREALMELLSE